MAQDPLHSTLTRALAAGRAAERAVFGAIDPDVRDTPPAQGEWSPKDVQAHLSAWKSRQTDRLRAAQRGETVADDGRTLDEINAEQHAARAGWAWEEIVQEAERVSDELGVAVAETDRRLLVEDERLMGGIFANGPSHAFEHLAPIAGRHGDTSEVERLAETLAAVGTDGSLPDRDAAVLVYNLACRHALEGRLDDARRLLPAAFRLRPDLVDFAPTDDDLVALREELEGLAGAVRRG